MNTDYLSIAQTGKYSHKYVVNGGTVPAGGQIIQHMDFSVPTQNGAIDRVMIALDNGPLKLGNNYGFDLSDGAGGFLEVYRTAPGTLRAEITINNLFGDTSVSYPLMTFTIKALSFRPPNVF